MLIDTSFRDQRNYLKLSASVVTPEQPWNAADTGSYRVRHLPYYRRVSRVSDSRDDYALYTEQVRAVPGSPCTQSQ